MNLTSTTENNFQFQTIIEQSPDEMISMNDFLVHSNIDIHDVLLREILLQEENDIDDIWIVIDDEIIKRIIEFNGDCNTREWVNKRYEFIKFIKKYYIETTEYKLVVNFSRPNYYTGNAKQRGGQNKKIYQMHIDAFKNLLMRKNNIVRKFFIELLKQVKKYCSYQNEFKIFQHKKTIDELQQNQFKLEPPCSIIIKKYETIEKIYIMTRKSYAKRNLYKIGRSTNVLKRLVSLNTGNVFEQDKLYICFIQPTYDAKNCENRIHNLLDRFKYKKEFYRLPFQSIKDIVVSVGESYIYHNMKTNEMITKLNDTGSVNLISRCKEEDIPRPLSRYEIQSTDTDIEDNELSCSDLDEEKKIEPNEKEIVTGEEKNDEEKDNGELNILKRIINEHYTSKNRIPIWIDICDLLKENLNTRKIDLKLWKNNVMRLENQKIRWRKNGKVETINPDNTNNISTNRKDINNINIKNVGTLTIYDYFNKRK